MTRRSSFTQRDVARLWKAAKDAGETVKVVVRPDGTMEAIPVVRRESAQLENEWDAVK